MLLFNLGGTHVTGNVVRPAIRRRRSTSHLVRSPTNLDQRAPLPNALYRARARVGTTADNTLHAPAHPVDVALLCLQVKDAQQLPLQQGLGLQVHFLYYNPVRTRSRLVQPEFSLLTA